MKMAAKPKNAVKRIVPRELMKEARLTGDLRQTDAATKRGRPQSYVAKVEGGERLLSFIEVLDYCKALGLEPVGNTSEEFGRAIQQDITRWATVAKRATGGAYP